MSFDHPVRFVIALALVALLAFAYALLTRRKTQQDLAYSNIPFFLEAARPRNWIPRTLYALLVASLVVLAVAIAGPKMTVPVPSRAGSIFICIDTSGSMQSTDVEPTREQAAKAAARAFIEEAPQGVKIGIISFSSNAAIVQPLTADRQQVIASLDSVPAPNGATAIGDALTLAGTNLPPSGHRVVILVTDGVNNTGADPQQAAQDLGAKHVPVYTVGIGTPNGDVIPGTNEQASIDEDSLRAYAAASGGSYSRVEDATQLQEALRRLGRITTIEYKHVDATTGFALGGACALVALLFIGIGIGRYP
jgi:Ca-activated chloride channel homolog